MNISYCDGASSIQCDIAMLASWNNKYLSWDMTFHQVACYRLGAEHHGVFLNDESIAGHLTLPRHASLVPDSQNILKPWQHVSKFIYKSMI